MQRIGEVLEPFPRLAVPEVHRDQSTSRLLVMHDVGGGPIEWRRRGTRGGRPPLLESFYKQIMVDGFFPPTRTRAT